MPRLKQLRKSRILITVFSMLSAVILIASLFTQIRLTEATDENASLRSRLEEISDENTRLKIIYESSVNLSELEDYAKNVLGMQRPGREDTIDTDAPSEDKAVVIKPSGKTDAEKLVSSFMEYLSEVKCKFN